MNDCKTVTLRTRPLKNRMLSFYLDYYPGYRDKETMKVIRHESLGIYIYANPKNKREQDFNEVMAEKAEAIRCRRFESVVNERYDFFDKYKLKADFLEYFRNQHIYIIDYQRPFILIGTTSVLTNTQNVGTNANRCISWYCIYVLYRLFSVLLWNVRYQIQCVE